MDISEVVDLNQDLNCPNDAAPNFPQKVQTAFGGLVQDQYPLVCGGEDEMGSRYPYCMLLNETGFSMVATMTEGTLYNKNWLVSTCNLGTREYQIRVSIFVQEENYLANKT